MSVSSGFVGSSGDIGHYGDYGNYVNSICATHRNPNITYNFRKTFFNNMKKNMWYLASNTGLISGISYLTFGVLYVAYDVWHRNSGI